MEDQKVDRSRMTDFSGKTAIVTGATGGMGRGIAEALARSGADLVVHTTNAVAGERLVRELRTRGVRALPVEADLRNLGEARRVAEQALGEFGRIDLLVNNAGIWDLSDLTNMTEAQWEETIDVNLKGPVFLTQASMRDMTNRGSGSIVNIGSSVAANGGSGPEGVAYNISKSGLQCFTKTLAKQLAPYGVRVNSVSPGIIDTPMLRRPFTDQDVKSFADSVPLGRLGTPKDIADAVIFLLSDAASYITGQALHVNGGTYMVDN